MNHLVLCALLVPLIGPDLSAADSRVRLETLAPHVERYGLIELAIQTPWRLLAGVSFVPAARTPVL
jgi:hypothetical protein